MLEFSENVLNAGKNADALDLSDRFLATFCTSGGYVSGAQPTLNALARILMTFGASTLVEVIGKADKGHVEWLRMTKMVLIGYGILV